MPGTLHEPAVLRRWRLVVPHAQVLTMQTVPIVIAPAPAITTNYYEIIGISVAANVAAGAYTNVNASPTLVFTAGNSGGPTIATSANIGLVIANVNFVAIGGPVVNLQSSNTASIVGREITMYGNNGPNTNFTGGNANNSLTVEIMTLEFNYDSTAV